MRAKSSKEANAYEHQEERCCRKRSTEAQRRNELFHHCEIPLRMQNAARTGDRACSASSCLTARKS
eukprot:6172317-Pleurochrysis_carterae.AAC.1